MHMFNYFILNNVDLVDFFTSYLPRTDISVTERGPISMLYIILLLLCCTNKCFYLTAEVQEKTYSIMLYIIVTL